MRLDALRELHAYDAWANVRCIAALPTHAPLPARRAMGHVVAALELWWSRWIGQPLQTWEAFPILATPELGTRAERIAQAWASALATVSEGELDMPCVFTDTRGVVHADSRRDLLVHLVTHGQHHRGQVASPLRSSGLAPAQADYAVYYRAQR